MYFFRQIEDNDTTVLCSHHQCTLTSPQAAYTVCKHQTTHVKLKTSDLCKNSPVIEAERTSSSESHPHLRIARWKKARQAETKKIYKSLKNLKRNIQQHSNKTEYKPMESSGSVTESEEESVPRKRMRRSEE